MFWIQTCNKHHQSNWKILCVLISTRQLKYFICKIKIQYQKSLWLCQIITKSVNKHIIFLTFLATEQGFSGHSLTVTDIWHLQTTDCAHSPHPQGFPFLWSLSWASFGENTGSLELNIYFLPFCLRTMLSTTARLQPEDNFFKVLTTQETFVMVF